jgi:hypothetical protein
MVIPRAIPAVLLVAGAVAMAQQPAKSGTFVLHKFAQPIGKEILPLLERLSKASNRWALTWIYWLTTLQWDIAGSFQQITRRGAHSRYRQRTQSCGAYARSRKEDDGPWERRHHKRRLK